MSGVMNLVLAQLRPRLRRTSENVETMGRIIGEYPEADLVVFPELFVSGYTTMKPEELAIDLDGPEVDAIARFAGKNSTAVVFGAPERVSGGVANSAICVNRGGNVAGSYRKTHLFGSEREAFVAGDELVLLDFDGVKVGLMICFDVEFPEVPRALAEAGADLFVTISANMDPFGRDHHVFATSRALENSVPHLYVNQVGEGEEFTFAGGSMLVSSDGERLAGTGASGEEVIQHQIDLSTKSVDRPENLRPDYLREMREPLPVMIAERTKHENRTV